MDKEDVWIFTLFLGSHWLCLQAYYAFFSEKIDETVEWMLPLDQTVMVEVTTNRH
jgi:hypothetical protein